MDSEKRHNNNYFMDIYSFYNLRVENYLNLSRINHRNATMLSFTRLVLFLLIPVVIAVFLNISLWLSISLAILFLALFGLSIKKHFYYQQEEIVDKFIAQTNNNELNSIKGDLKEFYSGIEFKPKDHKYASDLDIFGESSLYSLINRSSTWPGRKKVADWLLNQADIDTIIKRQESVLELKDKVDFRQKLQSYCIKTPDLSENPSSILDWVKEPCLISKPVLISITLILFSLFSVVGIIYACLGHGFGLLIVSLIINLPVGFRLRKEVNSTHEKLSRAGSYLKMYSKIIGSINEQKFESKLLNEYYSCFFNGEHSANHSIKRLSKIIDRFDLRFNVMISVPLNLFFFWDIWQLLSLERWKHYHGNDIAIWFDAIGEFEAVSSFANLYFNNPEWTFPKIENSSFVYNAKNLGHPLIPSTKRVCNDIAFNGTGKMLLVTGSNMSGKSTFLRTIGVNMVLAGAGSPVCSTNAEISIRSPFTSMRIADSLEENISTFYAELKRISEIIKDVDNGEPVILLLDEVLRGTNSIDRHKGALALLVQLVNTNAVGIMATHDLELADEELIDKGQIYPYFFDVQVDGDELFFDYKLHEGKCTTLNASILMKKMGIRLDHINDVNT